MIDIGVGQLEKGHDSDKEGEESKGHNCVGAKEDPLRDTEIAWTNYSCLQAHGSGVAHIHNEDEPQGLDNKDEDEREKHGLLEGWSSETSTWLSAQVALTPFV